MESALFNVHTESEGWKYLESQLKQKISNAESLDTIIEQIGQLGEGSAKYFKSYFTKPNSKPIKRIADDPSYFFSELLPFLQDLALRFPILFPDGLKLLLPQQPNTITITREQAACLVSLCFFCAFERIGPIKYPGSHFPDFTCASLHTGMRSAEKFECLLHYFDRYYKERPNGFITIERRVLDRNNTPDWSNRTSPITKVTTFDNGGIEDSNAEVHVDFANEYLGGGVLVGGCVQEEILFLVKPELIACMAFTAKMEDNETVVITGAERFSDYSGFGNISFTWKGPWKDKTPRLEDGSLMRKVVAMDAVVNSSGSGQFEISTFNRDLNKAYCGFSTSVLQSNTLSTGNWGTGAFGGDLQLKALQQILAASEANREVDYFTFKKGGLDTSITTFIKMAHEKNWTVGQIYTCYRDNIKTYGINSKNLLEFLSSKLNSS